MNDVRYIPVSPAPLGKSYLFQVELVRETPGCWRVHVPALPGCAAWGYTRAGALENIREAVERYIALPSVVQMVGTPVVAVTV